MIKLEEALRYFDNGRQVHTFERSDFVLLRYDLQLFAKEGPGGEKTEDATPKKLEDARKEGQVCQSTELSQSVTLLAFFVILKVFIGTVGTGFLEVFSGIYSRMSEFTTIVGGQISTKDFSSLINFLLIRTVILMLPFLLTGLLAGVAIEVVQVQWKPTTKPLTPKLSRLNPINGFKRMFSAEKLIDLLKSLLKLGVLGYVAVTAVIDEFPLFYGLYDMNIKTAVKNIGDFVINLGIKIAAIYLVIGFADFLYQKWKFANDMKMTKQEVKDEYKNAEGDPTIKGKQKQRMAEASRRRMMQAVPSADVVITNPTHFAVAIKYDPMVSDAPYVVAKGEDFLAARIKEIARDNNVEIVENKPLARMLYYNVDLGNSIPPELYQAVAEILAVIYNARRAS